jgi:hypothetical protein
MKAENLSPSTFANTMKMSAKPPLVIHIFSPFRMYSLPSSLKRAVALAAIASEPEPASVNAYAVINSPAAIFGRYLRFAASVAK